MKTHKVVYLTETNTQYSLYRPAEGTEVKSPCSCPGCKPVGLEKVVEQVKKVALATATALSKLDLHYRHQRQLLWVIKVEDTAVQVDTAYIGGESIRCMDNFTFTILVASDSPGQLNNLMSGKPKGVFYRAWGRDGVRWSEVNSGHNYNKYIDLLPEDTSTLILASQLTIIFRCVG
jgi:hypothetical protein